MRLSELKYASRLLFKRPLHSIISISVVAVGIAIPLYFMSLIYNFVYQDLPLKGGDRIVTVKALIDGGDEAIDLHDYQHLLHNSTMLEEMGAWRGQRAVVSLRDGARAVGTIRANASIFNFTGVEPFLGEVFTESDENRSAAPVAVLSHLFWVSQLGSDESIINQTIRIDGRSTRILGVMPEDYQFPFRTDFWLPMQLNPNVIPRGQGGAVRGFAKIKPEYSRTQVNEELDGLMQQLVEQYPDTNANTSAYAVSLPYSFYYGADPVLYAQFVIAGSLFLLAIINVSALLLARAMERSKETAVRMALGASRGRAIAQFMWEGLIICALGGTIGLLSAGWALEITQANLNKAGLTFYWWVDLGLDLHSMSIFVVMILSAVIVTGLIPGIRATNQDLMTTLRDGTSHSKGTRKSGGRFNFALVTAEVFLSSMLLITAAASALAMVQSVNVDYGVKNSDLMITTVTLPSEKYTASNARSLFVKDLQRSLQVQGKTNIAMVSVTASSEGPRLGYAIDGHVYGERYGDESGGYPRATIVAAASGSLPSLEVGLLEGRYFGSQDRTNSQPVAIVSHTLAKKQWPATTALGKRLKVVDSDDKEVWLTVVGVVEHVAYDNSATGAESQIPAIYLPFSQNPVLTFNLITHYEGTLASATQSMRLLTAAIDPDVAITDGRDYQEFMDRNYVSFRFLGQVFILLAGVGLLLASTGVYGMMSQTATQRTREMGIKRALGATESMIIKELLGYSSVQLLIGAAPGAAAGAALGWFINQSAGLSTISVGVTAVGVFLILSSILMLATWLPSKRIISLEPAVALRNE